MKSQISFSFSFSFLFPLSLQTLRLKPSTVGAAAIAHLDLPRSNRFLPRDGLRTGRVIVFVKPTLQRVDTAHTSPVPAAAFQREQVAPLPQHDHERAVGEEEEHGKRDRRPDGVDVASSGGVDLVVEIPDVHGVVERDRRHPAAARDHTAECLRRLPPLPRQQQPPDDAQRDGLQRRPDQREDERARDLRVDIIRCRVGAVSILEVIKCEYTGCVE